MAVSDVTEKNLLENSEATAGGITDANAKLDQQNALGKSLNNTADKQLKIAKKAVGMEEDEIRRQKEKDREAKRNKDKDKPAPGAPIPGAPKKGGGIFKAMGAFFGPMLKFLKPLWTVLKIVFKVLKFTAIGAGILLAGAFFTLPAGKQQGIIDSVMEAFTKIGEVITGLGKAFAGGFMKNMEDDPESGGEGLVTKFTKFKDAWGAALKKLRGIAFSLGGKSYKGLEGIAELFGDMIAKVVGFFLDMFTGIANFINDPTVAIAKIQVAIEDAFQSMGNVISNFFGKMFSMEGIMKMMQGVLGPDSKMFKALEWSFGTVEELALENEKEMMAERDTLKDRNKQMKENVKRTEKLLQAELAKGEDRDDDRVSTLQKALAREQAAQERNISQIARLQENIDESRANIIDERVLKDLGEINRRQEEINADRKEDIEDLKEDAADLQTDDIKADISGWGAMAGTVEFTKKTFESMMALLQKDKSLGMQGVTTQQLATGEVKLSKEAINALTTELGGTETARTALGNLSDQKIIFQSVLDRLSEIEKNKAEIAKEEATLAETEAQLVKKRLELTEKHKAQLAVERGEGNRHKGGPIKAGGIYRLLPNEMVLDNQAVAGLQTAIHATSGLNLMNLQRAQLDAGKGGSQIIIQDNSQKQVTQSQPLVLPNSPIQPGNDEAPRLLN